MTRVLHIAHGHVKDDIRIVQKECMSLYRNGYEVYYATLDKEDGRRAPEGIHFVPIHEENKSFLVNYVINQNLLNEYCVVIERIKPEIVHIHEYGISFLVDIIKKSYPQIKVIYDVHEDNMFFNYERDMEKYGKAAAYVVAHLRGYKEHIACKKADVVVSATPHLKKLLCKYTRNISVIRNYPIVRSNSVKGNAGKDNICCYVGGVTKERGITDLIKISSQIEGKLYIAGPVRDNYLRQLENRYFDTFNAKWFYEGFLNRNEVHELYSKSSVGVCLLKPTENYYHSLPIKLFEYMEAGLPVVVSDFPVWREIVEGAQCGYCVDEENLDEIREKINYLFNHPEEAQAMGENGRRAVLEKYNWGVEEKKLLQIYRELL